MSKSSMIQNTHEAIGHPHMSFTGIRSSTECHLNDRNDRNDRAPVQVASLKFGN